MSKLKCVKHMSRVMVFTNRDNDVVTIHRSNGAHCDSDYVTICNSDYTPIGVTAFESSKS